MIFYISSVVIIYDLVSTTVLNCFTENKIHLTEKVDNLENVLERRKLLSILKRKVLEKNWTAQNIY